jgi:hypothetical protein
LQDLQENGADIAHLNKLHTPLIVLGDNPVLEHQWFATWKPSTEKGHIADVLINHWIAWFHKKINRSFISTVIQQVGPGVVNMKMHTLFGNFYMIETATPRSDCFDLWVSHVIFGPKLNPMMNILGKIYLYGAWLQFCRDISVWQNKTYSRKPVLVKGDGDISGFRRWYSRFFEDQPTQNNL